MGGRPGLGAGLGLLAALLAVAAGSSALTSSLAPHRIPFPQELYRSPSGVFNPAAVWDPTLRAHVFVWRHDACFYKTCGVLHTKTRALVSIVPGNDTLQVENIMSAAASAQPWEIEPAAHARLLANNSASIAAYGDWRPFLWQGEVWAGHWIKLGWPVGQATPPAGQQCLATGTFGSHSCELSALSRLNFTTRQLELRLLFQKPLQGTRLRVEKNWGFLELKGDMHILYSTLPCTAVYRYDVGAPAAAVLVTEHCYPKSKLIGKRTGLNASDSRQSGNPVRWRGPDGRTRLLAMVHSRAQMDQYAHWLVLMDLDSLAVTHISAGSILQTAAYHTEGFMRGVLTVGSFHIAEGPHGQELRLLLGEGDQFSAFEDVELDQVVWWSMEGDQLLRSLTDRPPVVSRTRHRVLAA